jgi:hypothetical protein
MVDPDAEDSEDSNGKSTFKLFNSQPLRQLSLIPNMKEFQTIN